MTLHHDKSAYGKFETSKKLDEDSLDEMVKILNGKHETERSTDGKNDKTDNVKK